MTSEERFWAKVEKTETCWNWTGAVLKHGYGQTYKDGAQKYAHRASYELVVGPIPEGLVIDHLCRNRKCVNPEHLEPVTQKENVRRGEGVGKRHAQNTHCRCGREYLIYINLGIRRRYCRECNRIRSLAWYYKYKAAIKS